MTGKEQREKGPRATMQNVQNEEGKKDLEEKLTAIQKSKIPWSCLFHDFRCSPVPCPSQHFCCTMIISPCLGAPARELGIRFASPECIV
jgi:hypothetical protein